MFQSVRGRIMGFGGDAPVVQTTAPQEIKDADEKTKKLRTAQFATEGGASGEEVAKVSDRRGTLFGN